MDEIATSHDAFFRESFGRREIACDFLRHQLPAALLAEIDLGTLEISKDTYVSTGDPIMQTFIDRYIEQGRQQGIELGVAQGIEQGKQQGEAAVLLRLIDCKFGPPSESLHERIAAADTETLLRWSERILTADSLDAVLH